MALVATVAWGVWSRDRIAESVVTDVYGEVLCKDASSGLRFQLEIGNRISPGSKLMVGEQGRVDLSFEGGRGADVTVFPNTAMTLGERTNPTLNIITLFQGSFQAEVEKQGRKSPLTILTPNARSTVLGTEFRASRDALEVDEGLVRMERLSDGMVLDVPARHKVVVEDMVLRKMPGPDLKDGLVGRWGFDGKGNEILQDLSGNGADLELVGAKPTAGRFGGGLEFFDRAYAITESTDKLSISGSLTMSAWVKPSTPVERAGIVGKYLGEPGKSENESTGRSYAMKMPDLNPGIYVSSRGDMDSMTSVTSSEKIPVGEWTHIAVVYESSNFIRIYKDGELVMETTFGIPDSIDINDSPLLIGTSYSTGDARNFFNGAIDDVRIYSRAVSGREAQMLFEGEGR